MGRAHVFCGVFVFAVTLYSTPLSERDCGEIAGFGSLGNRPGMISMFGSQFEPDFAPEGRE
jgi:hypothetical protein